ncbi:MAG: OsmC family protein [Acidimicrobiales bacterium]
MTVITADLTSGTLVEIRNGRHVWHADEPLDLNGTDKGPNPYEQLLGALAACTSITLSFYAQRKGWNLESVSVRYEYEKLHVDDCNDCDGDAAGWLDGVRSEIFIEGDFDDTQKDRLAEIAKRCPVHKTLDNGITFISEKITVG